MDRLHQELHRLYLPTPTGTAVDAPGLIDSEGGVRAMVLELAGPADWALLSAVWKGVQQDLELPAPAIAVNGSDALQLWFSLVQPVPAAQAWAFLNALRAQYLAGVQPTRVRLLPVPSAQPGQTPAHALLVPAPQGDTGLWSAFVAPDLAPVMNDEPWLDLPPNPEGQAALLARLECTPVPDLLRALQSLRPSAPVPVPRPAPVEPGGATAPASPPASAPQADAAAFLQAVMHDSSAPLVLRVEAAKALLAHGR